MKKNKILVLVVAIIAVFSMVTMLSLNGRKIILPGGINMTFVTDEGAPIEGVQVEVCNSDMKPVETFESEHNGVAQSSKIMFSDKLFYKVKQAPDDVKIDSKIYALDLESDEKIDINVVLAKNK